MPTSRQQDDFKSYVFGNNILDSAIEWIGQNLDPETVFPEKDLEKWAEANGYVKSTDNG